MAKSDLTAESARQHVVYHPDTGLFSSLVHGANDRRSTTVGVNSCGYARVYVAGHTYKAHRLAWLMMTGSWPDGAIDHVNGNGCDNRWQNLREVSVRVNNENIRMARTDSMTRMLGVSRNLGGRYTAIIRVTLAGHRLQLYLGSYDTAADAHAVYVAAKRRLHDGCTI